MNQDPVLRDVVVQRARAAAGAWLSRGRDVVWDATNARQEHRLALLDLARRHQARAMAVAVHPALDVVLAQNGDREAVPCAGCGRSRRVPDDVVRRMHSEISCDLPGIPAEGWHELRVASPYCCPGVPA